MTSRALRIRYVPLVRTGGRTWAVGVVVAAAVLSGCTTTVIGTATSAGSGTASSAAHASGRPATAAPDAAQLDRVGLQLADLPAGWSAGDDGGPDEEIMRSVAGCLGARDAWTDVAVVGHASGFVDGSDDEIGSFAASYRSQRDVDDDAALLRDPRASACFGHAFDDSVGRTAVPGGASIGAADFTVVAGSGGGPSNLAGFGLGTLPVTTVSGQRTAIYVQFLLITGRMTEVQLFFLSIGAPLPAGLRADAVAAVARRAAAL